MEACDTSSASTRHAGAYAPLRSYAAIGDGRCVALVADDGAIDWLAWPDLDSPSVFGALLDAEEGGSFALAPTVPFTVTRRYLPDTSVLETTFRTEAGTVQVVDVLTMQGPHLGPSRELQRRVEALDGVVPMAWTVRPRFGFGLRPTRLGWRGRVPVATSGSDALAVCTVGAGTPQVGAGVIHGSFEARPGVVSVIALCGADKEPLVFPTAGELDERVAHTIAAWRTWTRGRVYYGPWRDAVIRSALTLKLLVYAPSGAIAAAATTSLPERLGGERNWDYRFCWVRDAALILAALLRLGCKPEAEAHFWWLLQATQLTHPRVQPLYRLDGGPRLPERSLPLTGYQSSRPVRIGNAAAGQHQLDSYGDLLQSAWLYVEAGGHLDAEIGSRLAEIADLLCRLWKKPDAGIWEVRSTPKHFTHSKMMCWVGLERARLLADAGHIPATHRDHWLEQASACHDFIEEHCYSTGLASYARAADGEELDASVLLGLLSGYGSPGSERWSTTVDALARGLGHGPYMHRYTGEDGLPGGEGAFLSCSFWLAEALARVGRVADATAMMDRLVALANDVGMYAEEIDPQSGAFLGNLPQGLSHLALISAAMTISEAMSEARP